jgi:hypothetical protein
VLTPGTYYLRLRSQTELAAADTPAAFNAATGTAYNTLSTPCV